MLSITSSRRNSSTRPDAVIPDIRQYALVLRQTSGSSWSCTGTRAIPSVLFITMSLSCIYRPNYPLGHLG